MNVILTPELETFIMSKMSTGLYSSQSEVVREGLRLLMERDRAVEYRMNQLRTDIAKGLEQARRGELIAGEEVFAKLRQKSRDHGR